LKGIDAIAGGNRDVFLQEFEKIKDIVIRNPDMLYKSYWVNGGVPH
jgi:hypothetical protein